MTNKDVIRNALEYYILVDAATKYDAEGKVAAAKGCLERLNTSEKVGREWILNEYSITSRAIRVYREYLSRFIKEAAPYEDISREKEEKRCLARIWTLFDDLPELPL